MRVVKISEVPAQPMGGRLFTGEATRQALVDDSPNVSVGLVNFGNGVRNKFHRHTSDQVLIVTSGSGIIATEEGERRIEVGDLVHSPAGEKHWHGAAPGSEFSHITITASGSETIQLED